METEDLFEILVSEDDRLLSFDEKAGYLHSSLRDEMLNYSMFHSYGKFYRCTAISFGCGRSAFSFVNLLKQFVRYIQYVLLVRMVSYIDEFSLSPSVGKSND